MPRSPYNLWALAHEESPKNNYLFSHPEVMELFNSTCTFRKESDYSINSLYVRDFRDLETSAFLVSVSEKNMYREVLNLYFAIMLSVRVSKLWSVL